MYLIEEVENLYENSVKGSADYLISDFILMHVSVLDLFSLSRIAAETGLPKSTVARYFESPVLTGGYTAFRKIVNAELGFRNVTLQRHIDWQIEQVYDLEKYRAVSSRDVRRLAAELVNAEQLTVIGNIRFRTEFQSLMCLLRDSGIRFRYFLDSGLYQHRKELESLGEKDIVLFLIPGKTAVEYSYLMNSEAQTVPFSSCGGKKYFIAQKKSARKDEQTVINFTIRGNPYQFRQAFMLMATELFLSFAEKAGLDPKHVLYIM